MDNSKIVVYAGTRNVYPQMYTSLKSLIVNTEVDMVYLLPGHTWNCFGVPWVICCRK